MIHSSRWSSDVPLVTNRGRPEIRTEHDWARRGSIRNNVVILLNVVNGRSWTAVWIGGGECGVDTGVEIVSRENAQIAVGRRVDGHRGDDGASRHCEGVCGQLLGKSIVSMLIEIEMVTLESLRV